MKLANLSVINSFLMQHSDRKLEISQMALIFALKILMVQNYGNRFNSIAITNYIVIDAKNISWNTVNITTVHVSSQKLESFPISVVVYLLSVFSFRTESLCLCITICITLPYLDITVVQCICREK